MLYMHIYMLRVKIVFFMIMGRLSNLKGSTGSFRRMDINRQGEKFIYHFCESSTERRSIRLRENDEDEERGNGRRGKTLEERATGRSREKQSEDFSFCTWLSGRRKEGAEKKHGRKGDGKERRQTEKYIQSSRDFSLLIYRANFYFSREILKPVVPAI